MFISDIRVLSVYLHVASSCQRAETQAISKGLFKKKQTVFYGVQLRCRAACVVVDDYYYPPDYMQLTAPYSMSDLAEGGISILKWASLILFLSGSIVSVGDPKKKYTRFEKIGQG